MAKLVRFAQIGGSVPIRKARREALELGALAQVVYDGDGYQFGVEQLLELSFDVAVIDQRLPNTSAFDFVTAAQALAKVTGVELGNILISTQYYQLDLRLAAIEAGAVDCIDIESGLDKFANAVAVSAEPGADFGIKEILDQIPSRSVSEVEYRQSAIALDTLDAKEAAIIKGFCELKTDAQIAQSAQVPKMKVRNTILKVQNLLMLNTRSQLLLKLTRLGTLSF